LSLEESGRCAAAWRAPSMKWIYFDTDRLD
jgi:hypothetical protein